MARIFRNIVVVTLLAAFVAAAIVLYRSRDPVYSVHEWISWSDFHRHDAMVISTARRHGLDPMLVKAVIWRESTFDPRKVGTNGERGLMQVTEVAAADWVATEKIQTFVPEDLFDPKTNIEIGSWYLRRAIERWKEKDDPLPFALAEYNAGRSRVNQWIDDTQMGKQVTADDLRDSISFPGTRKYVKTILGRYHFYRERGRM